MNEKQAIAWYRALETDTDYLTEDAKIGFAVCLERRMRQRDMTKADLARRLGTSQAYITKILRGDSNLTIASMVELAAAVDGAVHIHLAPRDASVRWLEVLQGPPRPSAPDSAVNIWVNQAKKPYGYLPVAA